MQQTRSSTVKRNKTKKVHLRFLLEMPRGKKSKTPIVEKIKRIVERYLMIMFIYDATCKSMTLVLYPRLPKDQFNEFNGKIPQWGHNH